MPRLFVGQIPTTCTEEDLLPVFAGYGEIEKVSLVRGPDNKSRGCCMVSVRRPRAAGTVPGPWCLPLLGLPALCRKVASARVLRA